jgi:hypothetical protein
MIAAPWPCSAGSRRGDGGRMPVDLRGRPAGGRAGWTDGLPVGVGVPADGVEIREGPTAERGRAHRTGMVCWGWVKPCPWSCC